MARAPRIEILEGFADTKPFDGKQNVVGASLVVLSTHPFATLASKQASRSSRSQRSYSTKDKESD